MAWSLMGIRRSDGKAEFRNMNLETGNSGSEPSVVQACCPAGVGGVPRPTRVGGPNCRVTFEGLVVAC